MLPFSFLGFSLPRFVSTETPGPLASREHGQEFGARETASRVAPSWWLPQTRANSSSDRQLAPWMFHCIQDAGAVPSLLSPQTQRYFQQCCPVQHLLLGVPPSVHPLLHKWFFSLTPSKYPLEEYPLFHLGRKQ